MISALMFSLLVVNSTPRTLVTLTLPKEWQKLGQQQTPEMRQVTFVAVEDGQQKMALLVNFFSKQKVQFEGIKQMTIEMLKKECHTEELPFEVRAKFDNKSFVAPPAQWILYACPSRKRSGWFFSYDADEKTVGQMSLELPIFPISGEIREALLTFLPQHLVFCKSMDSDCEMAVQESAKSMPNALIAFLPTYLDDKQVGEKQP